MKGGIGFGAHDARHGPKLGQSLASGPTGLQRRLELARDREREAALARRPAVAAKPVVVEPVSSVERIEAEAGTKRAAHRPRVVGEPWVAEGLSRAAWYRRRKGGAKGG